MSRSYGPLSDDHKARLSASLRGRPKPEGFGQKVSEAQRGKTKNWLIHPSTLSRKGKTYEQIFGKEKAKRLKTQRALVLTRTNVERCSGKTYEELYGADRALEIRRAVGRGSAWTPETIAANIEMLRAKAAHARSFVNTPSSIEMTFRRILDGAGIAYKSSVRIGIYEVDILIPPDLIVECDGRYWHNRPDITARDKVRDKWLSLQGFRVMRFWEDEIKEVPNILVAKIKRAVHSSIEGIDTSKAGLPIVEAVS